MGARATRATRAGLVAGATRATRARLVAGATRAAGAAGEGEGGGGQQGQQGEGEDGAHGGGLRGWDQGGNVQVSGWGRHVKGRVQRQAVGDCRHEACSRAGAVHAALQSGACKWL